MMDNELLGLHHITAIASHAKRNLDFYTGVLGQRLVKKTVNFDDPQTYHFYFGNETGEPGTILTFFPWEKMGKGKTGTGLATQIGYTVPASSFAFWIDRFKQFNVIQESVTESFGEQCLSFQDPDGLSIKLIVPKKIDDRKPWETNDVKADTATRGIHSVELTLKNIQPTVEILTDILGYQLLEQQDDRYRFVTTTIETAAIIDIIEAPGASRGILSAGIIHHIAFRVKDEVTQMNLREKIETKGLNITGKINRDYFYSVYFREPGGVLFEIATNNPGFTTDESVETLGSSLRLPKRYEHDRQTIEKILPALS
ncbi:MAG TPA: ring-cleaving dioxygenase [Chitinophagaceae bacterium]|nr:ring-cleaving dioxygenase [Chitinophagaceae bacterium]